MIPARMLGIHINGAVQWQRASSSDWTTHAADVSRRSPKPNATPMPLARQPYRGMDAYRDFARINSVTCQQEAHMSLVDQLPALLGVVVGVASSYLTTNLTERTRWQRNQAVRWDGRRLAAYTDYGNAVKEMVLLANRIAASRGLHSNVEPLDPDDEALTALAEAAARCSVLTETVRLLGDTDTITAARKMAHNAWRLEWFAQGRLDGGATAWDDAFKEYKDARDEYLLRARRHLQVTGFPTPLDRDWPLPWLSRPTAARSPEQTSSEQG
jgi:hypothetical protein